MPVERRVVREPSATCGRAGRADTCSRRRGTRRRRRRRAGAPTFRARDSPRAARRWTRSTARARQRRRATRSSSFWSTTMTRSRSYFCASIESRSRASSSVRPTVATTRSNDGSSRDTRRRLRDAHADRAARLRAPRRPRRRGIRPNRASRASSRRPSRTSSWSSSTTRRPTRTPEILAEIDDARLRVIRNDERLGLAGSLNRGLDEARGTFVARLDADDVALPRRLERQLARHRATPRAAVVGSAVMELDEAGRLGRVHAMPRGPSTCAGRRSSARLSSTRPSSSSATCSSVTASATTRASRRARTTTCGRGCSRWPTATTCPTARPLPRPSRSGLAAASRAPARTVSCGSRVRRSRASLRVSLRTACELAWRVGVGEPIARRRGRCCGCRVLGARWRVRARWGPRQPARAGGPGPHARWRPRLRGRAGANRRSGAASRSRACRRTSLRRRRERRRTALGAP